MNRNAIKHLVATAIIAAPLTAIAEQHIIEMKNAGADGSMVFEPGYLEAEPGDTVKFVATDPAHNSVSTEVPEGAESWSGALNEEITVTLSEEGVYVYKCTPHAVLNMAGIIRVGEPTNYDEAQVAVEELSSKAASNKERLRDYFSNVPQ